MNRTIVRVREEGRGHKHHKLSSLPDGTPKTHLTEIVIALPPVEPDELTLCDTEYLWRVPDDEVERRYGVAPLGPAYVCVHQVVID